MDAEHGKNKTDQKRGPSTELQRRLDNAIAARRSGNKGFDGSLHERDRQSASSLDFNEPGIPPVGARFEYLDHPADVILHSWGENFDACLTNIGLCMFGYITSLNSIIINTPQSEEYGTNIVAQGHDLGSLIYSFLDEWLYNFHDNGFIAKEITIIESDKVSWRIVSSGRGEVMDVRRHPQGTEIKAVTYNAMKIEDKEERCDIYVVVDI